MSRFSCYGVVDPANPEAAGICDRGGEVRKYRELQREMEWRGDRLVWNGFLVCPHHIDLPQSQDRARRLPTPDPTPIINPRPDRDFIQPAATGAGILEGVFIQDAMPVRQPTQTYFLDVDDAGTDGPPGQPLLGTDGQPLVGADGSLLYGTNP